MRHRKLLSVAVATCALWGFGAQGASAQESEVTGLLRELVRINTSNPPGNEAAVAELLRSKLEPLGFQIDVIQTPTPNKAHFVARLKAAQPTEKPLLLAGHEDTVGVEAPLWTVDPFGAVVKNGFVYGRGTMDFKGGLAAFTVAAMRLARSGVALKRDVILLAEADEEGGDYGTGWLAENHWDKIDAGVSLNEGGWIFKGAGGKPKLMGITTIDKNSLSVTLATRGTSTHSSRPLPDSAIRRLVRALRRIDGSRDRRDAHPHRPPLPEDLADGVRRLHRAHDRQAARREAREAAAPLRPRAEERPLRRAVQRPRPQHLRADDRRERLPRERPPGHRRGHGQPAHAPGPAPAPAAARARARDRRPEGQDHADHQRRAHRRGAAGLLRRAREAEALEHRHRPLRGAAARGRRRSGPACA